MVALALLVAVCAVIATHLGLSKAIVEVLSKIASCPMCCTMWCTLAALLYEGYNVIAAITLALIMSYLSNFIGLIFMGLQHLYDILWEKLNQRLRTQ